MTIKLEFICSTCTQNYRTIGFRGYIIHFSCYAQIILKAFFMELTKGEKMYGYSMQDSAMTLSKIPLKHELGVLCLITHGMSTP
jgi:hypothetical protein